MKFKKIYILCPGAVKTGGPELLHQLAYQINNLSSYKKAQVVYFGNTVKPVVKKFQKYLNNEWITESDVLDEHQNLIIFPETAISEFNKFKHAQKYIWWLSVDNYIYNNSFYASYKRFGLKTAIHYYLNGTIRNRDELIKRADLHLCQSYYAMKFLQKLNISNIAYLSDYINDFYVQNSKQLLKKKRRNIVLYNPKKGYSFTKKLINASPDNIKWIPLIGMSNKEVLEYLSSGKVYVDFGNHPGKDRFPREAALCGCCIITGKKGAARFNEDVSIPDNYKFNDDTKNIKNILNKIELLIQNYNAAIHDFASYRQKIMKEKGIFLKDCQKLFID